MATTITPKVLRTRAPVFGDVPASDLQLAIDEAVRWVAEQCWGASHFDDGVFYLACHILEEDAKLNREDLSPGETGDAVPPGPIRSERILNWSVTYGGRLETFDDALATTAWGRRFLSRRELVFCARCL